MRQFVTALLLLIAFCASAAPEADLIAAGRAALDRNDFDQAISQFERATAAQPNSAAAHYYLGLAHGAKAQKAGMFGGLSHIKTTVDEWNRAVALDPGYFNARLRLIEFYMNAPSIAGGSEEKAMQIAAEAKKHDALEGHRAYARLYTTQKKFDLATKEMVEAVREQPKSARTHYYLGNALLNQKDWKGSLH